MTYSHKCQRPKCGYEWTSRIENPFQCRRCGSYIWDSPLPRNYLPVEHAGIKGSTKPRAEDVVARRPRGGTYGAALAMKKRTV